MTQDQRRGNASGSWPIVNRLAQYNVALGIGIALMIRLSTSFSESQTDRPNPMAVIGFFVAMGAALFILRSIRKEIRMLVPRWKRVLAALVTFGMQLAILEILILVVAE